MLDTFLTSSNVGSVSVLLTFRDEISPLFHGFGAKCPIYHGKLSDLPYHLGSTLATEIL